MAKDQNKRLRPAALKEDRDALSAIKGFTTPPYKPANDDFTLAKLQAGQEAVDATREAEVQRQADLDAARDAATAAEWNFHNLILGGKRQVTAQYGESSDEQAAVGLKKKSERNAPGRPAKASLGK